MGMFQKFKNYFGLSTNIPENEDTKRPEKILKKDDDSAVTPRTTPDQYDSFGFNIFSSPLEMHRYFERQMNEMLKTFGIFGGEDSFFGSFNGRSDPFFGDNPFGHSETYEFPSIEDFGNGSQSKSGSLRDQYLKSGYESIPRGQRRVDQDVDEKFNVNELDTVLKNRPIQVQPRRFFYGQSSSTRTTRTADGTIETHRTVRDQDGNEETIVTKRHGDKEYTVTTKKNKDGQQEVIENMVNLDENEKDNFLKGNTRKLTNADVIIPPHDFPFEKFF